MSTHTGIQTEAIRVTWIGALLDAVLGVAKIIVGLLSHSGALVADGIHSLSDLATDALVVLMLKLSHQPPDREHPWGHGRIETLGTILLGCTLIAVAGGIAWNSVLNFVDHGDAPIPGWAGLLVAALSIASKEAIYRYTLAVGKRTNSDLLIANAWHSRTDALSSIVVLVGIGGSMLGMRWMDPLAAIIVAAMVAHIGWKLSWRNVQQLIDTAPPAAERQQILDTASAVPGVRSVHDMKARYIGSEMALEIHILVAPLSTASEGHFIAEQVRRALLDSQSALRQVIIHVDTDPEENLAGDRPARLEIEQQLDGWLKTQQLSLARLDLHYQNHRVDIELCLHWPGETQTPPADLITHLRSHVDNPDWLGRIRISYGVDG